MSDLATSLRARVESETARKLFKYSAVSAVSVVITFTVQAFCFGVLKVGGGRSGAIASTVAAVPSYFLNRNWVWGKRGRSHLMKEVIPFWVMFAIGLGCSIGVSDLAEKIAKDAGASHGLQSFIVPTASLGAFAVLWILKYVIFNKILFVHHPEDLDPALDGRSGLPT